MASPQLFHEKFTYLKRPPAADVHNVPSQADWEAQLGHVNTFEGFRNLLCAVAAQSKSAFVPHTAPILLMDGQPLLAVPIICVTAWNANMDTTLTAGQYLDLDMGDGVWFPVRVEQVMVSLIDTRSFFTARVVSAAYFWISNVFVNDDCRAAGPRERHSGIPLPGASPGIGAQRHGQGALFAASLLMRNSLTHDFLTGVSWQHEVSPNQCFLLGL
jgi:hypothetical protein